jgi:hypothetical protein
MEAGRLWRDLAFRPTIGLDDGVRDTAAWLRTYRAAELARSATSADDGIDRGG